MADAPQVTTAFELVPQDVKKQSDCSTYVRVHGGESFKLTTKTFLANCRPALGGWVRLL